MKALFVHPGTQHSFALARQLQRLGCLCRFWTGFAYLPDSLMGRGIGHLPTTVQSKIMGRSLYGLPAEKLRTRPGIDLRALRRLRAGQNEQTVMFERNEAFQHSIPEEEFAHSDVVIGVDTASWLLAARASALGRHFILDRTTGHPLAFEQLLPALHQQFPQWIESSQRRLPQLSSAEDIEHQHACRIAVGSSFARRTLVERGIPAEKIVITPLGIDLDRFLSMPRSNSTRPLRFVFVGSLSAVKGVPLLLDAWHSLGNVNAELWLIGSTSKRHARLIPRLPGLRVLGRVSRRDLPGTLRQCDVLVLPSYFEGFGAVLLEAMAMGLPIIATDSTAAPDLITDGVEGYVIPTGNGEALRDAIKRCIVSPGNLAPMSRAARRCAERYSWDAYGDRWMDILRHIENASSYDGLFHNVPVEVAEPAAVDDKPNGRPYHPVKALLAHPGTQHSFQLARQLQQRDCLSRFWTGMAYVPNGRFGHSVQFLPALVERQLANRRLEGVSANHIRTLPFLEWWALRRLRMGHEQQGVMFERNAAFQSKIPQRELEESNVVIGFDTSSWLLAERALALDRAFILDQTTGHPLSFQRILPVLHRQFPEWVEDVLPRLPRLLVAEQAEHRHAFRIVAASSFARRTLIENGVPAEKIVVNSYGVDLDVFSPVTRRDLTRPFRFIFVGAMTAAKGVPLLIEAWRALAPPDAEMWLVGSLSEDARLIAALPGLCFIGKVPHRELSRLFRQCDVLVLPSYYEGFGLVLLEALAAGLPIISTDATAAPDLITHGVEGYIVPVGDAEALQDAMQRFVTSSSDLAMMSRAARSTAERFSWDAYGGRWMDLLQQVV